MLKAATYLSFLVKAVVPLSDSIITEIAKVAVAAQASQDIDQPPSVNAPTSKVPPVRSKNLDKKRTS